MKWIDVLLGRLPEEREDDRAALQELHVRADRSTARANRLEQELRRVNDALRQHVNRPLH